MKRIILILCVLCLFSCVAVNAPIHSDVKSLLSYKEFLNIFFKDYDEYEIVESGIEELEFGFGERNIIYGTWELKYGDKEDESCIFNNNASFFHQLEGIYSTKIDEIFQNDDIYSLELNNLSQIDYIDGTYQNNIKKLKAYDQYIEQNYKEIYGPDFFGFNTPIQELFQHKNLLYLSAESSNDDADKILIKNIPHLNAIIFKDFQRITGLDNTVENLENFLQDWVFIVDGKRLSTEYLLKHKERNLLELFKEEVTKRGE